MIAGVALALVALGGDYTDAVVKTAPAYDLNPPVSVEAAPKAQPDPSMQSSGAQGFQRPNVNPYDRDLQITAPLLFGRRALGELPITLTADDRVLIERTTFLDLLRDVVNPEALAEITSLIGERLIFESEDISPAGVSLAYDPSTLSVAILRIDPARRSRGEIFAAGTRQPESSIQPEPFSAYVNLDAFATAQDGQIDPAGLVSGAIRFGNIVFEAEARGGRGVDGTTEFDRRYARLVYDEPEAYRRWYLGDLDPEFRGRQGYVPLGGIGVSRQRRRFNAFRSDILQGSRQLLLEQDSTVTILRNGVVFRELQLDAGPYDLSSLPLLAGSNDVEVRIRDLAGRTQLLNYSAYLDPIDLEPGDFEYGAFLGVSSKSFFGSPTYDGDPAFTGFYRKAFVDRPAVGVGLQLSEAVQGLYGETQLILRDGSRLQFNAAASNSESGAGYAAGISYDRQFDRGEQADYLTVQADFTSERFSTLGNIALQNFSDWSASAQYSRYFSARLYGTVNATYQTFRMDLDPTWRVTTTANYRFTPRVRASIGADYGRTAFRSGDRQEIGLRFSITWQPDFQRRSEVAYDQRTDSAVASYSKSGDGRVGSIGYGALVGYSDGPANVSAYADYVGNRGTVAFTQSATGEDFSSVSDRTATTLSVGTSLAITGGRIGIGRRINNSFAIVGEHQSLQGRRVIIGDSLEDGRYIASSGPLGPAVFSFLTPFVDQSIRYDVVNPPRGYDIGSGIFRVKPANRSGFALTVGTDAFVTAYGTLQRSDGEAVGLAAGVMRSLTEPDTAPVNVFTNRVGRFALSGLKPGGRYSINLSDADGTAFEFQVPTDTDGLLDLQVIKVPE
ncbi:fimbria/pilus outer membrane usher protein [Brevundimonas sp. SGAir0440]|uniref:fimbria/pilus outer membrane usher protein n=1 Tax=Brevundimonas sp. SGAir0440 TaxID=2579977 RepID=UPI0010CD4B4B|nr:fimbria/pilus outer membrane usher protein [Brevundimonas sp. SGAir0440]QCQ97355.1 hypothetical protein E7T10_01030 [Brevundimonas sp. SGAir0440]